MPKRRSEDGRGSVVDPNKDESEVGVDGKGKKGKKMRITRDGVTVAGLARKKVFDEDGASVVRMHFALPDSISLRSTQPNSPPAVRLDGSS